MSLKKWLTLSIALMVLGALLAVIGYFGIGVLMAIGLVPLVVGLMVYYGMCRCPECGAPLGRSPGSHCKRCGRVHSAAANGRWCGDQRPPCGLKTAGQISHYSQV